MGEILLKIRYFQRGLSKSLKKLTFSFQTQFLLIDKVINKGPGTSDQSLFIPLLVIYYLTKFGDIM